MGVVRSQRRQALEAREELADREVHTLQRRITKLHTALQETETRLSNVTAVRSIDEGISSIYKEVQGLNDSDDAFSHKQTLMENIFAANVRLQKKA
jgi:prefoldin subunit 5